VRAGYCIDTLRITPLFYMIRLSSASKTNVHQSSTSFDASKMCRIIKTKRFLKEMKKRKAILLDHNSKKKTTEKNKENKIITPINVDEITNLNQIQEEGNIEIKQEENIEKWKEIFDTLKKKAKYNNEADVQIKHEQNDDALIDDRDLIQDELDDIKGEVVVNDTIEKKGCR